MPKLRTESSTVRRYKLTNFVDFFSITIIKSYLIYKKHGRVYKVYIRLGKCNKCLYYN